MGGDTTEVGDSNPVTPNSNPSREQLVQDKVILDPASERLGEWKLQAEVLQCLGLDTLIRKFVHDRLTRR